MSSIFGSGGFGSAAASVSPSRNGAAADPLSYAERKRITEKMERGELPKNALDLAVYDAKLLKAKQQKEAELAEKTKRGYDEEETDKIKEWIKQHDELEAKRAKENAARTRLGLPGLTREELAEKEREGGLLGDNVSALPKADKPSIFNNLGATASSPFGSSTPAAQPSASTPSPFSLGGVSSTAAPTSTTPSLFGGASSSTTSTARPPIFGATPTQPSSTSGGLFGSAFGASNPTATAGSTSAPSTSLFGQSQAAPKPAASPFGSGSAFGGAPSNPFGGSTSAPAGSAFGSSTFGSGSTLGQSTLFPGAGSSPATATAAVSGVPAMPSVNPVEAQIQAIEKKREMQFQYYFYNLVNPEEAHLYGRPSNATNEELWQKANRENPNPQRLVPALAAGFDDLQKRVQAQQTQIDGQLAAIRVIRNQLQTLQSQHSLTIAPSLTRVSRAHTQLVTRLSTLVARLHHFLPDASSSSSIALGAGGLGMEEEILRGKLESINAQLAQLGAGGGGRMGEVWSVVARMKALQESGAWGYDGVTGSTLGASHGGWSVVDPAAFEEIKNILVEEQQGLK